MNAFSCIALILALALSSACTGRFPNAQRTLLRVTGYGMSLEVGQSSASGNATGPEMEVNVGKWASQAKRGSSFGLGMIQQPGPPPTSWTAVTGGVGVITVTRFDSIPAGATQMLYRAIDTTTGLVTANWNGSLTGLVSGRIYKVQASWWNGLQQASEASVAVNVAAG